MTGFYLLEYIIVQKTDTNKYEDCFNYLNLELIYVIVINDLILYNCPSIINLLKVS